MRRQPVVLPTVKNASNVLYLKLIENALSRMAKPWRFAHMTTAHTSSDQGSVQEHAVVYSWHCRASSVQDIFPQKDFHQAAEALRTAEKHG